MPGGGGSGGAGGAAGAVVVEEVVAVAPAAKEGCGAGGVEPGRPRELMITFRLRKLMAIAVSGVGWWWCRRPDFGVWGGVGGGVVSSAG